MTKKHKRNSKKTLGANITERFDLAYAQSNPIIQWTNIDPNDQLLFSLSNTEK
jgi:hypothetical protein